MIYMKKYNPVIVFSFSKRDCESLALKMSKLDFNTDEERNSLTQIFIMPLNCYLKLIVNYLKLKTFYHY